MCGMCRIEAACLCCCCDHDKHTSLALLAASSALSRASSSLRRASWQRRWRCVLHNTNYNMNYVRARITGVNRLCQQTLDHVSSVISAPSHRYRSSCDTDKKSRQPVLPHSPPLHAVALPPVSVFRLLRARESCATLRFCGMPHVHELHVPRLAS